MTSSEVIHDASSVIEADVSEERQKLAVFIDFDNIQIGVKDTLGKEFDVAVVLEALKERGEVVTKVAYGDWHRAGDQSRQMTQHAVQMVQRNPTPRGDKNGADINLALDALEMAFTRHHINTFAIVGGDSDFIALVEKLKQYDKRVLIVGGRSFTSGILQRNCHEFISYENLLKGDGRTGAQRAARSRGPTTAETRALGAALPNLERALKILAEREVAPQIGLLKSTLLQLDPTFSERDYGAGSFLEFLEKMQRAGLVRLARTERGFLVESGVSEGEPAARPEREAAVPAPEASAGVPVSPAEAAPEAAALPSIRQPTDSRADSDRSAGLEKLRSALGRAVKGPSRPLYMRHVLKALRTEEKDFKEQSYGFRNLLDLLHFGERQGVLRLERDRRGVLKIFPTVQAAAGTTPAEPAPGMEAAVLQSPAEFLAMVDQEVVAEPPAAEGLAAGETIEEAAVSSQPPPEVVATEAVPPEAAAEVKTRRPRAKRGARGPHRKTGPRRKSVTPPSPIEGAPST